MLLRNPEQGNNRNFVDLWTITSHLKQKHLALNVFYFLPKPDKLQIKKDLKAISMIFTNLVKHSNGLHDQFTNYFFGKFCKTRNVKSG